MSESPLASGRAGYSKPLLTRLAVHDEAHSTCSPALPIALSAMDLLRVVQSSLDELGLPRGRSMVELKLKALEEVSGGRLTNALNLAILQSAALAVEAASAAAKGTDGSSRKA